MLEIIVHRPIKTDDRYEFRYSMRIERSLRSRVLQPVRASANVPSGTPTTFGFRALNFAIDHHEVWDGFYPLFYLTRNGGPLFRVGPRRARIRFEYPIPAVLTAFFIRRAEDFGHAIEIEAETNDARIDGTTDGHVLAFGGGKDSRLVLGAMREMGLDPRVMTSGAENVHDISDALVTEPVIGLPGRLADRVMPSFMALGHELYLGTALADAPVTRPWRQAYDITSDIALDEMSQLLSSLGVSMGLYAPATVLPYSIVQQILGQRYPDLYAGQVSVPPESGKEKNLQISLLELHHGLAFTEHCSEPLFRQLLSKFVRRQISYPNRFAYRNSREWVNLEMRAIIWRHRDEPLFEDVREQVLADWEGEWIDYIHTYVSTRLDGRFLDIFREYAPTVDEAPDGEEVQRIAI